MLFNLWVISPTANFLGVQTFWIFMVYKTSLSDVFFFFFFFFCGLSVCAGMFALVSETVGIADLNTLAHLRQWLWS